MRGRSDQAWAVVKRLHHDANDPSDTAAHEEFLSMRAQIEFEQTQPTGYLGILKTPSYRKRAFLSCFVQFAANNTGALVINYYSVIIYGNLGLSGSLSLLLYCIYTLIGALGNLFSLLTVDKTGRRFVSLRSFPVSEARFRPPLADFFDFAGPSHRIFRLPCCSYPRDRHAGRVRCRAQSELGG